MELSRCGDVDRIGTSNPKAGREASRRARQLFVDRQQP